MPNGRFQPNHLTMLCFRFGTRFPLAQSRHEGLELDILCSTDCCCSSCRRSANWTSIWNYICPSRMQEESFLRRPNCCPLCKYLFKGCRNHNDAVFLDGNPVWNWRQIRLQVGNFLSCRVLLLILWHSLDRDQPFPFTREAFCALD